MNGFLFNDAESPPPTPVVPNHRLHRRIGRGSYGEVWLATDAMKKWRAVKVVHRRPSGGSDPGYERELQAIHRYEEISHKHASLVPILAVGKDEPQDRFFYYSMELADDARTEGRFELAEDALEKSAEHLAGYQPRTLRAGLRHRQRLPPGKCVDYGIALATALEQLHSNALIHRDIKPDNIIFVHGEPKLADVGLVAFADATYSLAGTDAYLSPEGQRKEPADVYALGLVLYEMVMGRGVRDFPALPTDFDMLDEAERTRIRELNSIILRATENKVQDRYQSAKALRADLELIRSGESIVRVHELEKRDYQRQIEAKARGRRNRIRLFIGIAVTLAGVIGALMFLLTVNRQRARERAISIDLLKAQVNRNSLPFDGWSISNWMTLQRAAADGFSPNEIKAQAALVLAGFDARRIHSFANKVSADAAWAHLDTAPRRQR